MAASSLRSPEELAGYRLQDPKLTDVEHNIASMEHRQRLIKSWGIPRGAKVLEIGCGQGDITIALADAVGPSGRVVGVDPAPQTYGTPPLSAAQPHILASPVGAQIEFVMAHAEAYLESTAETFDFIIFCHCVWYFGDPTFLPQMLARAAAKASVAELLIAKFSLAASRPPAVPHVLAALALNALESFNPERSWRNVCCALTPTQIIAAAGTAGWALRSEEMVVPVVGQRDAWREVTMLLRKNGPFETDVEALQVSAKVKSMLFGMRDAVAMSVDRVEGGMQGLRNMDVWAARFKAV